MSAFAQRCQRGCGQYQHERDEECPALGVNLLLDEYADAVRRRFQANLNFSRCGPGEIADRLADEKAARQRVVQAMLKQK